MEKKIHPIKLEEVGSYFSTDTQSLCCPKCGDFFTHHDVVEVFCRSDDAPEGVHVKVTGSVMVDKDMKENPSPRREGVVISFFCENCPGKFELHIVQHKGNTLLYINDLDLKVIPEVKV